VNYHDLFEPAKWGAISSGLTHQTEAWLSKEDTGSTIQTKVVRGNHSRTRADLFEEWGEQLGFTAGFGRNWDAFEDFVSHFDWIDADRLAILIDDGDKILECDESDFQTFWAILQSAAGWLESPHAETEGYGKTTRYVFVTSQLPKLEQRLTRGDITVPLLTNAERA
jgi:hypothetical protein